MKRKQRTLAPIARSSKARSPIIPTQTNACGTENTRGTISNPSVTSSRWLSNHATSLWQNWDGTQKNEDSEREWRCVGMEDVERKDDNDGWTKIVQKDSYKQI